jgi:transposase-like protein
VGTHKQNEELRLRQVNEFLESGMKAKDWCRENGVSADALRYWQRKFEADGRVQSKWIELSALTPNMINTLPEPVPHTTAEPVTIKIVAITVEIVAGADPQDIKAALLTVASLC